MKITKDILWDCIQIGYNLPEDDDDITDEMMILPDDGVESQYSFEFGCMCKREEIDIKKSDIDEYLIDILYDSGSEYKIEDIK